MKDMNIKLYVVTTAIRYEGQIAKWIFTDLKKAAGRYQDIVSNLDDASEGCDSVTLTGPFQLGCNINSNLGVIICRHDFEMFREIEQEEVDNQAD